MNDHLELCHTGRHDCSYVSLILLWRREYSGCTTSVLHFGKQIAYLEYEKQPRVIHLFEISILSYRFLFLHIVGLGMLIEYGMFGKMNMSCGITWTFPEAKWGEFSKTPFTDNLLLPLKVDAGRKNKAIWLFSWEPKDWTHFNLDTCIMPSLNSDSVSLNIPYLFLQWQGWQICCYNLQIVFCLKVNFLEDSGGISYFLLKLFHCAPIWLLTN